MTQTNELELLDYVEQDVRCLDIYQSMFNSAKPKIVNESLCLISLEKGIYVSLYNDMRIESIILHAEGEKFQQYQGKLPAGLSFEFSKEEVNNLLGNPYRSGKPESNNMFSTDFNWDSYQMANKYLQIIYNINIQGIIIRSNEHSTMWKSI